MQDLREFAHVITEKIDLVDDDLDSKWRLTKLLDVGVAVNIDDEGEKYIKASWVLDGSTLSIESTTTGSRRQ